MSDETPRTTSNSNAAADQTTIEEKLNALIRSRLAIINAIKRKGVNDITDKTILSNIPDYIDSINSGLPELDPITYVSKGSGSEYVSKGTFTTEYPGVLYCNYIIKGGEHTGIPDNYKEVVFYITIKPPGKPQYNLYEYQSTYMSKSETTMVSLDASTVIGWNIKPHSAGGDETLAVAIFYELYLAYVKE